MLFLLINLVIGAMTVVIIKNTPSDKDIFELMDDFNNLLESCNERTKEMILNLIDVIMENKALGYLFLLMYSSIPILNLVLLYRAIKDWNKANYTKE